jgi:hypothetical protein
MSILRRFGVACVVGAIAFGVTAGVASAVKPTRGCPDSFQLTLVSSDPNTPVGVDKNADGWVCRKEVGVPGGNYVDNTSNH